MPAFPSLLLALVHGVEAGDLANAAGLSANGCVLPLPATPAHGGTALRHHELTSILRRHGLVLDRRSLVLRPRGRPDATAVAQLTARPTGPAPVTLLEFDAPLQTALHHGAASPTTRKAVAATGVLLRRAADLLRRGEDTEVWILASGRARSVARTVDLHSALCAALAPGLHREFRCSMRPEVARIATTSQRVRDLIEARLGAEPFPKLGHVHRAAGPNEPLRFAAAPGIAFGTAPLFARPAAPGSGAWSARLPHPPRSSLPLDLAHVVARFWLAAAARLPQAEQLRARLGSQLSEPPDLLRALQHRPTAAAHDELRPLST